MNIRSLRLRLMTLTMVWVIVSLVAAALVLQYLFTINIERSAREEMAAAISRLAALIVPAADPPAIRSPMTDPRYDTPFGGRYWQIEAIDTKTVTRLRSMWDEGIDVADDYEGVFHHSMPDGRHLILLTRRLQVDGPAGPRTYLVTVGQDHDPIYRANQAFARDTTRLLILLGAAILAAAYLLLLLGLGPISRMRQSIEAVHRGDAPAPGRSIPQRDRAFGG
ncbi:hypothetical protein N8D56_09670 [Devosia sp. A8/3-2]|nr:hypothetical protein N8D56_09670 [Devosia sp. A8/3-2]